MNQTYQAQITYVQANQLKNYKIQATSVYATRTPILFLFLITLNLNFSQSYTQELNHTNLTNLPSAIHSLNSLNYIHETFRNLKIPKIPDFDLTDPALNLSIISNDQTPDATPGTAQSRNRFFSAPAPLVQKPDLAHLEDLTHVEPANRITDLIDPKFYDGYIKPGDLSKTAATNGAMYTLTNPGRYYISNDIIVAPNNNSVTAIKITANNVLLDLNRTTLSQASSSSATSLIGIELAANVTNVIIQNGRIDNFNTSSGKGIKINQGCSNVIIRDVIISRSNTYGLLISGIDGTPAYAIYLTNLKIINNTTYGLVASYCNSLYVENSNFDSNNQGIYLQNCDAAIVENCTSNENSVTGFLAGISVITCTNCWFKDCQVANNQTSGTQSVYGFHVVSSSSNIRFTNCAAYGQIASASSPRFAAGFYFDQTTKYSIIEDSYSYGNGAGTTYAGYGIYFGDGSSAGPLNCIVRNCQIYNNYGVTKSYGFYDWASAAVGSTTVLAHNIASGNGGVEPGLGNISPGNANSANYYILYAQSPQVHSSNNLFMEGNITQIGAINGTGTLGEFQNLSIVS